eukprot:COSAG02_NODE_1994_length_10160_cov_84.117483_13_plen_80_part_00
MLAPRSLRYFLAISLDRWYFSERIRPHYNDEATGHAPEQQLTALTASSTTTSEAQVTLARRLCDLCVAKRMVAIGQQQR